MLGVLVWYWIIQLLHRGFSPAPRDGVGGVEALMFAFGIGLLWFLGGCLVASAAQEEAQAQERGLTP